MSLGEDAKQDMYCNEAEVDCLLRGNLWKTRSGKVIPVPEMTDDHLLNAQRFMSERNFWEQSGLLLKEMNRRRLEPLPIR